MTTFRFFSVPHSRPRALVSAFALVSMLGMTGCSTMEDGWDAVFGDDDPAPVAAAPETAEESVPRAPAAPVAEELIPSPNPNPYDKEALRREPTVRHALVETPSVPQVVQAPPPVAPASRTAPMTPASGEALAGGPLSAPQAAPLASAPAPTPEPLLLASGSQAPAQPEQGLLIAPAGGGAPVTAYGDEAVNGLGTTVIGGDGSVAIEPYMPVDYAGTYDAGYGNAYGGPQSMDAFNPAGTGVSTLVATIQFGHGSSQLTARDRKVLRQVVALQKQYGGSLRVIGHASSRTANMTMEQHQLVNFTTSAQRAEVVAGALAGLGIPMAQIHAVAVSDNEPVYHEVMPSGEAGNRRAEIYLDY